MTHVCLMSGCEQLERGRKHAHAEFQGSSGFRIASLALTAANGSEAGRCSGLQAPLGAKRASEEPRLYNKTSTSPSPPSRWNKGNPTLFSTLMVVKEGNSVNVNIGNEGCVYVVDAMRQGLNCKPTSMAATLPGCMEMVRSHTTSAACTTTKASSLSTSTASRASVAQGNSRMLGGLKRAPAQPNDPAHVENKPFKPPRLIV